MTTGADNLVLELLRAMRADVARIAEDVRTLRVEMQATRHHTRGMEITSETPSPYEPRPTKRG